MVGGEINRLVLKLGTENLSSEIEIGDRTEKRLDQRRFSDVARQVATIQKERGIEIIIVTSGAIRAGKEELRGKSEIRRLGKKELAIVGTLSLFGRWEEALQVFGAKIGPILITFGNLSNREEKVVAKSSILNLLRVGIIPVINENDAVSKLEIEWMERGISENDMLAAKIALLTEADAILFLTDEDGVYDGDPKKNCEARLLEELSAWAPPEKLFDNFESVSEGGTGGMKMKIQAACQCAKEGMRVAIAGGEEEDAIIKFVRGTSIGTKIGVANKFRF